MGHVTAAHLEQGIKVLARNSGPHKYSCDYRKLVLARSNFITITLDTAMQTNWQEQFRSPRLP
jgi:hypothetical protein